MNVTVQPELLVWARERASLSQVALAHKVGSPNKPAPIEVWESTGELPLNKLELVAKKTYVPIGYLFLERPPNEDLPIPDYRTMDGSLVERPSPALIDTLYACIQRQDWYRQYLADIEVNDLDFAGKYSIDSDPISLAEEIRSFVGWNTEERSAESQMNLVVGRFANLVEKTGVLVMRNGVVGNNTHRPLNPNEFRGFTLYDPVAPLIFVNAADAAVAQLFTIAHELVHIWIGQSGLVDVSLTSTRPIEQFCNRVAAEILVPGQEIASEWQGFDSNGRELQRLCRKFRVSRYVLLIKALDAGLIDKDRFETAYRTEQDRLVETGPGSKGGNYYYTQRSRLGRTFARAVILSAKTGRTLMRDAYELLGVKKYDTFVRLANVMEVPF